MTTKKILITPGDGIGPEVTKQAVQILENVAPLFDIQLDLTEKPVGGIAYDLTGTPLPDETLDAAKISFGAGIICKFTPCCNIRGSGKCFNT